MTIWSELSLLYMCQANIICLVLFMHMMPCAFVFALANVGRSIPARIAMIAITTRSSIRVNPERSVRADGLAGEIFIGLRQAWAKCRIFLSQAWIGALS